MLRALSSPLSSSSSAAAAVSSLDFCSGGDAACLQEVRALWFSLPPSLPQAQAGEKDRQSAVDQVTPIQWSLSRLNH